MTKQEHAANVIIAQQGAMIAEMHHTLVQIVAASETGFPEALARARAIIAKVEGQS